MARKGKGTTLVYIIRSTLTCQWQRKASTNARRLGRKRSPAVAKLREAPLRHAQLPICDAFALFAHLRADLVATLHNGSQLLFTGARLLELFVGAAGEVRLICIADGGEERLEILKRTSERIETRFLPL